MVEKIGDDVTELVMFNTSMSGVDAQHLETRRFQIEEICRFFGVMPIMIGYSDKASTYASAEQMFLAHVVHTLAPWYTRLQATAMAGTVEDVLRTLIALHPTVLGTAIATYDDETKLRGTLQYFSLWI